ncbi:MAG TPA: hypothetical protein ENK43_04005 [Planctomycetes bacterium]|nr:hypothetical protein [Planctomycetota bacterium]
MDPIRSSTLRILPALLCLVSAACVTLEPKTPSRRPETKEAAAAARGSRRAAMRVQGQGTELDLDGMILRFPDHAGWSGLLEVDEGRLRVGRLRVVYDADTVRLFLPSGVATLPRRPGQRWSVRQDGTFGRSVFKD